MGGVRARRALRAVTGFEEEIAAARAGALERLSGGLHHDVFVAGDVVVKVFRASARDEPLREWEALAALAGTGLAATPMAFDPSPPEVVVMSLLPGRALSSVAELTSARVEVLGAGHRRLHGLRPPASRRLSLSHPATLLPRTRSMFGEWDDVSPELGDVVGEAKTWLASPAGDRLVSGAGSAFCQGDPNLANTLWSEDGDGSSLRFLDFEDSGLGDPAFEVGDLAEHLSTRGAPDSLWDELADATGLSAVVDGPRILEARRLMACFWLVILERRRRRGEPPVQLDVVQQADRVRTLLL